MEMSAQGYVCGNVYCRNFKPPFLFPRIKPSKKTETNTIIKEPVPRIIKNRVRCCPNANFDVKNFFESMGYIGSVQSRANEYFCYQYNDLYLVITGLREKTNFNVINQNDLDIVERIIHVNFPVNSFIAEQLKNICMEGNYESSRINAIKKLIRQKKDEFNQLYWLMLYSCYILSAKGIIRLEKNGHAVQFILNQQITLPTRSPNAYSNIKYYLNVNENTAVFEMDPFYFEIRCKMYRGTLIPYTKEEIDYLNQLIGQVPPHKEVDIPDLIKKMDYTHRFHRLYELLEYRNIRNDRTDREYFEQRIKSGLELVAKLYRNIHVRKYGRSKIFKRI